MEREKIIQVAINTKDEVIALTNKGDILIHNGTTWQDIALPEKVDYAKKIETRIDQRESGSIGIAR